MSGKANSFRSLYLKSLSPPFSHSLPFCTGAPYPPSRLIRHKCARVPRWVTALISPCLVLPVGAQRTNRNPNDHPYPLSRRVRSASQRRGQAPTCGEKLKKTAKQEKHRTSEEDQHSKESPLVSTCTKRTLKFSVNVDKTQRTREHHHEKRHSNYAPGSR